MRWLAADPHLGKLDDHFAREIAGRRGRCLAEIDLIKRRRFAFRSSRGSARRRVSVISARIAALSKSTASWSTARGNYHF